MIFNYIIRQADTDQVSQVIKTFQEAAKPEDREAIMTIAERLIEKGKIEGLEQGILQGIEKGMHLVALNMLKENADKNFISKVTGLSQPISFFATSPITLLFLICTMVIS